MAVSNWISLPYLGNFSENYNFNLNPLNLDFEASYGSTISLINGKLPDGLRWRLEGNSVIIEGESTGVSESIDSNFTLRIATPYGTVGDRTYYMTIVPVSAMPSWAGQTQFLGYATIGKTATFTVTATSPNTIPVRYTLIRAPQGMTLDQKTGVITYVVPVPSLLPIPYESRNSFTIRATVGNLYEDLQVAVVVLGVPHPPAWITDEGEIGRYTIGQYVEYTFEAYEPQENPVTYSLVNPPPGFPFTLTSTGFLYGIVPFTIYEPLYTFSIAATSIAGSSVRTFGIQAVQETESIQMMWNLPSPNLGTIKDGSIVNIDVGAISKRNITVTHSFIGGTIPPNLTLNLSQGYISGFLEYHPRPRNYYFEIMAYDGVQTMFRKYILRVEPSLGSQIADVSIPITGELRQAVLDTNGYMIGDADVVPFSNTEKYMAADRMLLFGGMDYSKEDPDLLMRSANLYLHSTTLMIGNVSNVSIGDQGHLVLYRQVVDPQSQADISIATQSSNPSIMYPVSLDNMRTDMIKNIGYANVGQGTGLVLIPNINPEFTNLESVSIINSGDGYYFSPVVNIVGTGNGAVVSCTLTVKSAAVIDGGQGWTIGDEISFMVSKTQSITVVVSQTGPNGILKTLDVSDGGTFQIFPQGRKSLLGKNGSMAIVEFNLGIKDVEVVSGGVGYSYGDTTISYGKEILPDWLPVWQPAIPIGTIYPSSLYDVMSRYPEAEPLMRNLNPWNIQYLTVDAQGKTWTGDTMFDGDKCTFDGDQTGFVEWSEPSDTIFDLDDTVFDMDNTVFDINKLFVPMAYRMWGLTIFDKELTFFDIYRTIFDEAGPSTRSITARRKIYRLLTPQLSGHNVVV